jgi:hypothetical protein
MKAMANQEQSAARAVQKLPVGVPLQPSHQPAPERADVSPTLLRPAGDREKTPVPDVPVSEWLVRGPQHEPPRLEAFRAAEDARSVTPGDAMVDRLERAVAREVVTIRQLNAGSLTVVLRPDPQSEIVLSLRQQKGHVEASARCEPALFQALQRDWSGLQESLAQLNVRLLPLERGPAGGPPTPTTAENPGGSGEFAQWADRSSQQQSRPDRTPTWPGGEEEPTRLNPARHATHREVHPARSRATGWEVWA